MEQDDERQATVAGGLQGLSHAGRINGAALLGRVEIWPEYSRREHRCQVDRPKESLQELLESEVPGNEHS